MSDLDLPQQMARFPAACIQSRDFEQRAYRHHVLTIARRISRRRFHKLKMAIVDFGPVTVQVDLNKPICDAA